MFRDWLPWTNHPNDYYYSVHTGERPLVGPPKFLYRPVKGQLETEASYQPAPLSKGTTRFGQVKPVFSFKVPTVEVGMILHHHYFSQCQQPALRLDDSASDKSQLWLSIKAVRRKKSHNRKYGIRSLDHRCLLSFSSFSWRKLAIQLKGAGPSMVSASHGRRSRSQGSDGPQGSLTCIIDSVQQKTRSDVGKRWGLGEIWAVFLIIVTLPHCTCSVHH